MIKLQKFEDENSVLNCEVSVHGVLNEKNDLTKLRKLIELQCKEDFLAGVIELQLFLKPDSVLLQIH